MKLEFVLEIVKVFYLMIPGKTDPFPALTLFSAQTMPYFIASYTN